MLTDHLAAPRLEAFERWLLNTDPQRSDRVGVLARARRTGAPYSAAELAAAVREFHLAEATAPAVCVWCERAIEPSAIDVSLHGGGVMTWHRTCRFQFEKAADS